MQALSAERVSRVILSDLRADRTFRSWSCISLRILAESTETTTFEAGGERSFYLHGTIILPAPTMPRKTSVYAPRDQPPPHKKFDLQTSLRRSQTTRQLGSTGLPTWMSQAGPIPLRSLALPLTERSRSTSAQTVLSTSSSMQLRPPLPDFGPASKIASASSSTLGLPKSSSMSSSLPMKKQVQADSIRPARPAPAPPAETVPKFHQSTAPSLIRSSTLYAPTASSLARMQATVKPTPDRPLPVPPIPTAPRFANTIKPLGTASSRENMLLESNIHLSKAPPTIPKVTHPAAPRTMKSPSKTKMRARASGLSAVKSRGNLRGEVEVQKRKAEIKARQQRLVEERGLREMLGAGNSGDVQMS